MKLKQVIPYGGSYREVWDDQYRLKIAYENRQTRTLLFRDGKWQPTDTLPALNYAEQYFPQAASAATAIDSFLGSGLSAQNLWELAPDKCQGHVFAAECFRILLDDYGMQMETVYPYVLPCMGEDLTEQETAAVMVLQPRTFHLIQLLKQLSGSIPPVRHDIRLPEYRTPFGAVEATQEVRLAFRAPKEAFDEAFVELYGDNFKREIPMNSDEAGWHAVFLAPETPAALWYRFRVVSRESFQWICPAPDGIHSWLRSSAHDGFRFTVTVPGFETPDWFRHAVMYQVFPDRFAFSDNKTAEEGVVYHQSLRQSPELHGSLTEEVRWQPRPFETDYTPDDFYGGTLNGIRAKLPYLKELGITCIYLNPIVESRSNHRYDTSDYTRVDPILGTNEDFEILCSEAMRQGIHIICDGVFSHTGADSIYFNRDGHYPNPGACQKEASPYDSWYVFRHFPDDYRSWWGFRELPEVNENDPAWQDYVVTGENSVVRQWLRRGASGWRLDVADELPDEVLELIRCSAKEENKDNLVLGEVWEDAILKESYGGRRRYALGSALDTVMNYPFRTAILDFLHGEINAFALSDFLTGQQLHYPRPMYQCLMNLLGSHDVERLMTTLAVSCRLKDLPRDKQIAVEAALTEEDWRRAERMERMAAAIQFTVPGVPSIYYGDEIGMTGTNDPFNRRPMAQACASVDRSSLFEYIRALANLRNSNKCLQEGEAFFLACSNDVLVVVRSLEKQVITVVNRSDCQQGYSVCLPCCKTEGIVDALSAKILVL